MNTLQPKRAAPPVQALELLREQSLATLAQQELERRIISGEFAAGAKLNEEATNANATSVRQNTVLEGATAYINLLRQNELVDLSGQNETNIRKQLNLEDERVRRALNLAIDRRGSAKAMEQITPMFRVGALLRPGSTFARSDQELTALPGFGRDIKATRDEARRLLAEAGALDPAGALAIYQETGARVAAIAAEAVTRPRLKSAPEVMASLIPPPRPCPTDNGPAPEARAELFGHDLKAMDEPQPMSRLINWALHEKFQVLKECQRRLDRASLVSPRQEAVASILRYARKPVPVVM